MKNPSSPVVALAGAGVLSEAAYLAITVRLPWWRYGGSLASWSGLLGKGRETLARMLAGIGLLMLAYALGWWAVRRGVGRKLIWAFAGLYALTLFWLLPITSDLFIYLSRAHMMTDLGSDPLNDAPLEDKEADPLVRAYPAAYARYSSVYGPAWFFLSAPGTLGPYDVSTGVAYLKGLAVVAFAGCAWLLDRILQRLRPGDAVEGLYLFAWNPLVLLLAVGDGHNDMAMMGLVVAAAWLLFDARWILAFAALASAVWIKYVGAVLLPLFLLYLWKWAVRDGKNPWPLLLQAGLPVVAITMLVFAPFGEPEGLTALIERLLAPANWGAGSGNLPSWGMAAGLLLFVVAFAVLVYRLARGGASFQQLANASFAAVFLAFALGAARSQPWHLIWPVALAALADRRWIWPVVAILSAVMLAVQVWVEWGAPGV